MFCLKLRFALVSKFHGDIMMILVMLRFGLSCSSLSLSSSRVLYLLQWSTFSNCREGRKRDNMMGLSAGGLSVWSKWERRGIVCGTGMAILRGCSHMRSTKFWDFFYPLPPCHCPIHPSYQYCCHVLGCPLPPSVYMDVICERPLSQGSSVSQTRLSGVMAVGGLRWKGRERSLGGLRSRFRGFARKRGRIFANAMVCIFHPIPHIC